MKSVKMLSEELGVSKQTIFNNIKRLNIETIKQENTSFIKEDDDIEKIVLRVNENKKKYGFENVTDNKQKNDSENISVEYKGNDQIIEILKEQINTLNNQIEKQESRHETTIGFYRKELQERSKLLENQQVLALESNKKIQKLENQLEEERQLNYSFDASTNNRQNVDAQESSYMNETENNANMQKDQQTEVKYTDLVEEKEEESSEYKATDNSTKKEPEPKKGFWNRLFGN
ncbi:DUF536 domain-containing protein [Staphylococcus xylosus]